MNIKFTFTVYEYITVYKYILLSNFIHIYILYSSNKNVINANCLSFNDPKLRKKNRKKQNTHNKMMYHVICTTKRHHLSFSYAVKREYMKYF